LTLPTLPINQMPATRSGTKYVVGPEHYVQYARENGVFIGRINKRRQHFDERRATRFQTVRTQKKGSSWEICHPLLWEYPLLANDGYD
jgi:hypothetical protein